MSQKLVEDFVTFFFVKAGNTISCVRRYFRPQNHTLSLEKTREFAYSKLFSDFSRACKKGCKNLIMWVKVVQKGK